MTIFKKILWFFCVLLFDEFSPAKNDNELETPKVIATKALPQGNFKLFIYVFVILCYLSDLQWDQLRLWISCVWLKSRGLIKRMVDNKWKAPQFLTNESFHSLKNEWIKSHQIEMKERAKEMFSMTTLIYLHLNSFLWLPQKKTDKLSWFLFFFYFRVNDRTVNLNKWKKKK